jgi:hypothetical protein
LSRMVSSEERRQLASHVIDLRLDR